MSSSRADHLRIALAALLASGCVSAGSQRAPEAPRDEVRLVAQPSARTGGREPVIEIAAAKIVRATDVLELLPRLRIEPSRDLVVIDVRMREPLDLLRDAAASIVLNGTLLRNTVPIDAQHLVAAVSAHELRDENTVSVTYAGAEKTTTPARPVVVRSP